MAARKPPVYSAFLSCSLREDDGPAVEWVERLLRRYRIRPSGTVGRHEQAPEPISSTMRKQVAAHECVVVVATPRYQQMDTRGPDSFLGISEMLHVEAGMAYALDKPVLVFVQRGVDVRAFMAGVTQYIIMPESQEEVASAAPRIDAYMRNARAEMQQRREAKEFDNAKRFSLGALATVGFVGIMQSILSSRDCDDDYDDEYDDD